MSNRTWMYNGWQRGKAPSNEWVDGTNGFLNIAFSIPGVAENDTIKCPCAQCQNYFRHIRLTVEMHLCWYGFKEDYETWTEHGEGLISHDGYDGVGNREGTDEVDQMDQMLVDLAGHHPPILDAEPTAYAKAFYRMVASADELVHDRTTHSRLSAIARLIAVKSRYNMSVAEYDDILGIVHELLPPDSKLPNDFYQSRKLLEGLGMQYIKNDVCYNNCMLFYKDNKEKEKCDFCAENRYKEGRTKVACKVLRYLPITDRLQRLYLHGDTAKLMRSYSPTTSGNMVHPCDGESWQQFNVDYPEFAKEKRNVRLAVATDGFQPFDVNAAPYSCWPVFVTPLNLPPGTLLRSEYIFLALVIPGPEHPGRKLNILMQPLVDEFQELWNGVTTWDASLKEEFTMRGIYFWSVHDFMAYGDFVGWSTHGRLSCPYGCGCRGFLLPNGRKACWFDTHRRFLPEDHPFRYDANAFRKNTMVFDEAPRYLTGEEVQAHVNQFAGDTLTYGKSHNWTHALCFRQLPYFHKLLLPHNIDVMHNEKNMGEAIWNTCFDIAEKSKDNVKARLDLAIICNRPSMHLVQKSNGQWNRPRGPFSIHKDVKPTILQWFKDLKFPDSYASNLKRGVNLQQKKVFGLKSHDYHIFMERLLAVVFRGFLPDNVWRCLAELSFFYRQLCAKELRKDVVRSMEENVAVLLCKMEKIFPPGFFNVMQHLIVHLPYEARLGGPVLARWCYPYERCIQKLRKKVRNKAHVEAGIVEAFLVEEAANTLSLYFRPHAPSVRNKVPRYDDCASSFQSTCDLDIFKCPGRCMSPRGICELSNKEYKVAFLYILTNMPEMDSFFLHFDNEQWKSHIAPTEQQRRDLSTRNKRVPSRYRPAERNDGSESAGGSIRHTRRLANSSVAQTNEGSGTATAGNAAQTTTIVEAPPIEAPKKRGRKTGFRTKFKLPAHGFKVVLKPSGDEQFSYIYFPAPYKYTTQLGVIVRREYPGVIVEVDENGDEFKRPALDWSDYFHKNPEATGMTRGEKVVSEFWRLFQVPEGDQQAADCVLEACLKRRVRNMMYQVRVDAVKKYYWEIKHLVIKKAVACHIDLEYEQYKQGKLEGFSDEVWPLLCVYWCSDDYKVKRKRGQTSRSSNEDISQNRGGSRPFTETQQVLEANFGPQKATPINTFATMKSGMKSLDSTGRCGPVSNQKAQKLMDDYFAVVKRIECANEEDGDGADMEVDGHEVEQQQYLNEKALYDVSSGAPRKHGRLAIAHGAVKYSDVRAAGRERSVHPSNSATTQNISREMEELRRANGRLEQENRDKDNALQQSNVLVGLVLNLYRETGRVVPEEALRHLSATQAIATGSSHAASESDNNANDVSHTNEDLHAVNIGNNQGSDNNGDHASII